MKFRDYLKDKIPYIILAIMFYTVMLVFLVAFRVRAEIVVVLSFCWGIFALLTFLIGYFRRRNFYNSLLRNIDNLDQAYLVLEILEKPRFYDGDVLYEALYAINKSMAENVQKYIDDSHNFREYIELWVHEVKTPLATLSLMSRDRKINEQLKRLDDYAEQVLYFARAQNAEHDYYIKPTNLSKVVSLVASRNQDIILANNIKLITENLDQEVLTDAKWLEFILNQIINNSIKYRSSEIRIVAQRSNNVTKLSITDNGIGIDEKDLPRVFEKSFTGQNGHDDRQKSIGQRATGMGLYLAKSLCGKLGHSITVKSRHRQGTTVTITFFDHDYYNVTKK